MNYRLQDFIGILYQDYISFFLFLYGVSYH